MWSPLDREFDGSLDGRAREETIPIPCERGQIMIRVSKADASPLAIDVGSRWMVTYTLELEGMERTETVGYASTYNDAISAVRSYLSAVRSARTENGRLDAMDVKSQLDALAPSQSEPMITGTEEHRMEDERRSTPSSQL